MTFLAPLFMLGALAVGIPVIFHLIRRTTRDVTLFSSLMFLTPTPPRVTRRSRVENWWLLLLRCLAILLLAIGFARPLIPSESASAQPLQPMGKRTLVLIDTSASMRREDLWAQARTKAGEILNRVDSGDEVAVVAFDRGSRTLLSFEEWRQLPPGERASAATQRLESAAPGWAATQLGAALLRSAEMLDVEPSSVAMRREIVIVSDLQEGARLDGLQGFAWPRGIEVVLAPVTAGQTENASAQWIAESDESGQGGAEPEPRLRVSNAAESKREQFALEWAGGAKLDVHVPPGQTRIVRAPKQLGVRADHLALSGDEVEFDNTLFVLPPEPARLPVLFLGDEVPDDPKQSLYYLERAFHATRTERIELLARPADQAPAAFELAKAQLLIVGDGAGEAAIGAARAFAAGGKIVLLPMTSESSEQTLSRLLDSPAIPAAEARVKDYAMLAEIDFQHPLFAPFADPRFSDFSKIHFWNYRQLDASKIPGARVIARFDSGDAAIVQVPVGKGSVMVFTSSWRPADSQLALSSKFVPLLHALLEQSSDLPLRKAQYFVGDEVALPANPLPHKIRKPDGREVEVARGGKFTESDQPGVYSTAPGNERFVVNLSPDESKLAPLDSARLAALGVPMRTSALTVASVAAQNEIHAGELESRQKLWRWLIVFALAVLLMETLLAGRLSGTPAPQT